MEKQRSLNIVHTESHINWGGQELRVLNECLWMQSRGHRVSLLAPVESEIYRQAKAAGIPGESLSFSRKRALADSLRVRQFLKQQQPDVLKTHGNMDAKVALIGAKGLNIPCVIRSRHHTNPVSSKWYNRYLYGRCSDYVFTTASATSKQIVRDLEVPPERVKTVASGITLPASLTDREQARQALCDELGCPAGARFIGNVSMMRRWKGQRFLVEAFATLLKTSPDYHLVIVGEGGELESLRRQADALGLQDKVSLIGFREDPWPYLRAMDAFVLPSTRHEGIPQVVLQAMYAGCPVVASRVGGIPDVVLHEETGLLVDPQQPLQIAQALQLLLGQPGLTASLVRRAGEMVEQQFTIDRMGESILQLYRQKLGH